MTVTPRLRALLVWSIVVASLALAQVLVARGVSPLADSDVAMQRTAFPDTVGPRTRAPLTAGSTPQAGRRCVVFFVRAAQQRPLLAALRHRPALPSGVDSVVVGGQPVLARTPVPTVTDVDQSLAERYAMRRPRDGGYPVGYALVGADGTVRYRTLDPAVARHLSEVRTVLEGLR